MRSIISMTLAACAVAAMSSLALAQTPGAGHAAGAAVGGRNARRDAVRYSLWHVDRA